MRLYNPALVRRRELSQAIERELLNSFGVDRYTTHEFTGTLLRKIRESQGIELSEIAKLTKISSTHLQAIEAEKFADLPALVYTRGFVQQLAKFLKLDPTQVSKTYLRRLRDWRALSDGDPEP